MTALELLRAEFVALVDLHKARYQRKPPKDPTGWEPPNPAEGRHTWRKGTPDKKPQPKSEPSGSSYKLTFKQPYGPLREEVFDSRQEAEAFVHEMNRRAPELKDFQLHRSVQGGPWRKLRTTFAATAAPATPPAATPPPLTPRALIARWEDPAPRDWQDDDPAAPWNAAPRWVREPNDGAQWLPPEFGNTVVVFKNPEGHRRRGLYSMRYMVSAASLDGFYSAGDSLERLREMVPGHDGFDAQTLAEVRGHLMEYWRINHPTEEQTARMEAQRRAREEADRQRREAERAMQEETTRRLEQWRRDEAERTNRRREEERATGKWMNDPHTGLKSAQADKLMQALVAGGLTVADSADVHDKAQRHRAIYGGSWADAYRFAVHYVNHLKRG